MSILDSMSDPKGWDLFTYNGIVKQVETVSDILRNRVESLRPLLAANHDKVAARLIRHLETTIADLDVRALRMLALYDSAAADMRKRGVKRDPRRDLFKAPADNKR